MASEFWGRSRRDLGAPSRSPFTVTPGGVGVHEGLAPLDAGLQGPSPGWGRPQRRRQLLDRWPADRVLEDGGSEGFSPREKEQAEG